MKNIAVITGGSAAERSISLKSADVVCRHLDQNLFRPFKVIINTAEWVVEENGNTIATIDKNDFSCVVHGEPIVFDMAFVALHGTPAEDGKLQGYLDLLNIPYNCCGVLQAAITFDKNRCKQLLAHHGIQSAKAKLLKDTNFILEEVAEGLTFPLFVKPNKNGSSYGAAKVDVADALHEALMNAFKYDDEVLVEEFIQGTEVTCGLMRMDGEVAAFPLTEIRSKNAFFDYKAKYEGASSEITPAEIDAKIALAIQATSKRIYELLDFKGMCRIDYILRGEEYYMLEVNSVPGLSEESIVPQQARAFGLSLQELFTLSLA